MPDVSLPSELGKTALAVLVLPLAFVVVGALLGAGPVGWILLAVLGVVVVTLHSWWSGGVELERPERVNCGACGAPNDPDREVCDHCEAAL